MLIQPWPLPNQELPDQVRAILGTGAQSQSSVLVLDAGSHLVTSSRLCLGGSWQAVCAGGRGGGRHCRVASPHHAQCSHPRATNKRAGLCVGERLAPVTELFRGKCTLSPSPSVLSGEPGGLQRMGQRGRTEAGAGA